MAGKRKSGLIIPSGWEDEFKKNNPRNREKERILFEKLESGINKLKKKEKEPTETTVGRLGGTERI